MINTESIIKALRCSASAGSPGNCEECPYYSVEEDEDFF